MSCHADLRPARPATHFSLRDGHLFAGYARAFIVLCVGARANLSGVSEKPKRHPRLAPSGWDFRNFTDGKIRLRGLEPLQAAGSVLLLNHSVSLDCSEAARR
jgi:hypothetical protein